MTVLLAPYKESMRLGQGYNSFSQELCTEGAVLQSNGKSCSDRSLSRASTNQNSSCSARFVENIDDYLEVIGASAYQVIKTGSISGSTSASRINLDRFAENDINYLIQIKATKETTLSSSSLLFHRLESLETSGVGMTKETNLPSSCSSPKSGERLVMADFTSIYGDSFISGFLEGGQLTALLSIEVRDKGKYSSIRSLLERSIGPALSKTTDPVVVSDALYQLEAELSSYAVTTVYVDSTSAGNTSNTSASWTIASIIKYAANFTNSSTNAPQRTHAILTNYTALQSFRRIIGDFAPPTFEHTQWHIRELLHDYLKYRTILARIEASESTSSTIWKRPLTTSEPEPVSASVPAIKNEVTSTPVTAGLLLDGGASKPPTGNKAPFVNGTTSSGNQQQNPAPSEPTTTKAPEYGATSTLLPSRLSQLSAFQLDLSGIRAARRQCQFEMIQLAEEANAIARNPSIVSDPKPPMLYIPPSIFATFLPASIFPENPTTRGTAASNGYTDPSAPLLPKVPSLQPSTGSSKPVNPKPIEPPQNGPPKPTPPSQNTYVNGLPPGPVLPYPPYNPSSPNGKSSSSSLYTDPRPLFHAAKLSMQRLAGQKGGSFKISYFSGSSDGSTDSTFFNDLDLIDSTFQIRHVHVWWSERSITGLKMKYTNGKELMRGKNSLGESASMTCAQGEKIIAVKLYSARTRTQGLTTISGIRLVTSNAEAYEFLDAQSEYRDVKAFHSHAPGFDWSLKGFYGEYGAAFDKLGLVWGKD